MTTNDLETLWMEHRVLRQDFYTHEAVVEERWKTVFKELQEVKTTTAAAHIEIKERINALNKLVLTVSGTAIVLMAGWIATLII